MEGKEKRKEKVRVRGNSEWKRKVKQRPILLILIKEKVTRKRFRAHQKEN